MNRSLALGFTVGTLTTLAAIAGYSPSRNPVSATPEPPPPAVKPAETRTYENVLTPVKDPKPLLADFPQYVEPVIESRRFEAPRLVDDPGADLDLRAWRWSYNARGIVEMP